MSAPNSALGMFPALHFGRENIPFTAGQYVAADEQLFVNAWNSAAGAVLVLRWRILRADGAIVTDNQSFALTSARAINSQLFPLCEGTLLGVTISVSGATPKRGQTFVQVGIARGAVASAEQGSLLISDYCTASDFAGWPGGEQRAPSDGAGFLRSITGTDPAAGVEISETVPTNARWRLLAITATLVTSAVVGSRFPELIVDDGASTYYRQNAQSSQAASLTVVYSGNNGSWSGQNVGTRQVWPLANEMELAAGHRIRTSTTNIDGGDNWSAPQYLVEEWIDV
jgi:hypothetical protein